mmetsp:Transcript_36279/g.116187  ORF Transcript_36279/g.116187 Transcript_36279/m.116187 type:complete len:212 (-) Transcript_36279:216-851(-)
MWEAGRGQACGAACCAVNGRTRVRHAQGGLVGAPRARLAFPAAVRAAVEEQELGEVHPVQAEGEAVGAHADVALRAAVEAGGGGVHHREQHRHVLHDLHAREQPLDGPQQRRPPVVAVHERVHERVEEERHVEDGGAHVAADKVRRNHRRRCQVVVVVQRGERLARGEQQRRVDPLHKLGGVPRLDEERRRRHWLAEQPVRRQRSCAELPD